MDCEYVQRPDNNLVEFKVRTDHCGDLRGVIRGDLEMAEGKGKIKETKCVFLTVHDVGTNHHSIEDMIVNHEFAEIKKRAVFVHVDLPGQEDHAGKLKEKFPSFQRLAEDLVVVLDQFKVGAVVALGVGAGANIAARFALVHPSRCRGLVLVRPCTLSASFFGSTSLTKTQQRKSKERDIPRDNVRKYLDQMNNRSDISHTLRKSLKCELLVITGAKAKINKELLEEMRSVFGSSPRLNHVNVHGCQEDIETDKPGKIAEAILLFVQGMGLLPSVPLVSCNKFFNKFPAAKV